MGKLVKQLKWDALGPTFSRPSPSTDHFEWSIETFSSVQLLSRVWLFATPWTAAHQASLSLTIFRSLPKFTFSGSVMPSSQLILWYLLLLLSIFPSIRDFSSELSVHIRWPKYWSLGFSISQYSASVNIQGWSPLRLTALISLLSKGLSGVFSSTTVQKHQFLGLQLSLWSNCHSHAWLLEKP